MGVGIDEAREDDFAVEVDFLGFARRRMYFDAAPGTDGRDAILVDQNGAVADDSEFAERFAATGD
jgi:hypothetical protein